MKAIYRGPGDSVELDGMTVKRGESVELTHEQYTRIQNSDPEAKIDVAKTSAPTKREG